MNAPRREAKTKVLNDPDAAPNLPDCGPSGGNAKARSSEPLKSFWDELLMNRNLDLLQSVAYFTHEVPIPSYKLCAEEISTGITE